jgi:hypothetical protein
MDSCIYPTTTATSKQVRNWPSKIAPKSTAQQNKNLGSKASLAATT